jgi:sortase A
VGLAAHNRGTNEFFGKLSTLKEGDTITYTTRLGTRSYAVSSVSKISVEEVSVLDSAGENTLTLITCVRNEPQYRWCVKAAEIV